MQSSTMLNEIHKSLSVKFDLQTSYELMLITIYLKPSHCSILCECYICISRLLMSVIFNVCINYSTDLSFVALLN